MTPKEFQSALDASYDLINKVSDHSGITRWKVLATDYLKNRCKIGMLPKWWPKKDINAITIKPCLIWLTPQFFSQLPEWQAATLLHEAIHVAQYYEGRLTWLNYVIDKHKRAELEAEGDAEEKLFIKHYKLFKHGSVWHGSGKQGGSAGSGID